MCLNNTAAPCLPVCPPCPCSVFMFLSLKCTTLQTVTLYFLQTKKTTRGEGERRYKLQIDMWIAAFLRIQLLGQPKTACHLKNKKKQKRLTFFLQLALF